MCNVVPNAVAAYWLMDYKATMPTRQALECSIAPQSLQSCVNGCPGHQHLAGGTVQLIEQQELLIMHCARCYTGNQIFSAGARKKMLFNQGVPYCSARSFDLAAWPAAPGRSCGLKQGTAGALAMDMALRQYQCRDQRADLQALLTSPVSICHL